MMMRKTIIAHILLLCSLVFILPSCKKDESGNGGHLWINAPVAEDVVMYEANPRVFAATNSLKAIEDRLDNIQALGVNVLWVMPIYTHGVKLYKGSPYCIRNYTAIDPEYGTMDDLKSLVDAAHRRGMAVLMDWVANHTSWDNVWIDEHPDWYTQEDGKIISPKGTGWNDVADLNYENNDLRRAMIEAMKFWITEADVDGYRCDAADYVPIDFWKEAVTELRATKSNLLMLAEGDKEDYFSAGFNFDFGWNYYDTLGKLYNGIPGKKVTPSQFVNIIDKKLNNLTATKRTLHFTTNHDKTSDEKNDVKMFNGTRGAIAAFVITATYAGTPLIYSSQETGHEGKFSFFTYFALDWDENPEITAEYQKIMSVYKSSDIFRNKYMTTYSADKTNEDVLYYTHTKGNQMVLVLVNVRNTESIFIVPEEFKGTSYKNLMGGDDVTLNETMTMPAFQYFILEKK